MHLGLCTLTEIIHAWRGNCFTIFLYLLIIRMIYKYILKLFFNEDRASEIWLKLAGVNISQLIAWDVILSCWEDIPSPPSEL